MKFNYLVVIILLSLNACTPVSQSSSKSASIPKTLTYTDRQYELRIKTVLLHPNKAPLLPAVTEIGNWSLVLEFDDLVEATETYNARIVHCNHDWTPSSLQNLDYLTSFNEYPINNYEFSVDTHIPYVHYWLNLPPVKLPGNYVVVVYRGSDKDDIVLSRRFMVFDQSISVMTEQNLLGAGRISSLNQQLNFKISYKNLDILNPMMDVHVNVRQNQRWDNIAMNIKPTFIREIDKEIDYRYFDEGQMFKGGNEFRFFDLRSLNYPGRNVASIDKKVAPFHAFIETDKSRRGQSYAQYDDLDGLFRLDNYDTRGMSYANYVMVNFSLSTPKLNGEVYVAGAFNNWALNKINRMSYDSVRSKYSADILLKQGWYDYEYYVKAQNMEPHYFEGSHFETENYYEVFVYYRAIKPQADLLVGYLTLAKNPR
ncbi:type IX secretion system plug protein [Pseudochryseolinea flava]|uniref:DUF5103 domain-containing protein n=1 Tax=Pseudochryseolinea flava TaxID=2059302 RepID=A0A364XYJ0_9BACT|nr:DUF5103 domain-containing protein [Pseudochryseolinea flava]RAV99569.1 DUF5103 domain-containing protein [Pseudochryseolinea flava]